MIKFEKIPADILSNVPMAKDLLEQDANVVNGDISKFWWEKVEYKRIAN